MCFIDFRAHPIQAEMRIQEEISELQEPKVSVTCQCVYQTLYTTWAYRTP